jgi:hypothetical protein
MKRTLLLSNVLLALLITVSIWFLHHRHVEAQSTEARFLNSRVQAPPALVFATKPPVSVGAQAYVDNAVQKFVFSRDRNPNVIEKLTAPPPEAPMPPLPALYGVFIMGDVPTIFLGIGGAPQRGYQAGARVGDFTLVAFDDKTVTFTWNQKEVKRTLEELAQNQAVAPPPPVTQTAAVMPPVVSHAENSGKPDAASRPCVAGDDSPSGTVAPDGYKKVIIQTPVGSACRWDK